jgi:ABC-2 type transport system permease protein
MAGWDVMKKTKGSVSSRAKYFEYLRISFQSVLAYRARYFVGVITYMVHIAVYYFIYKALFANSTSIEGYSLPDMVTYVSIGWVAKSFYLNYIDQELAQNVRMGQIAMDLVKPVDFQLMYYFRGYGQSLFRICLFTPPIVLASVLVFPINAPAGWMNLGLFFISTFFSALIYLGINYVMGILAVFFLSIEGVLHPKNLMIELFSGLLIPIDWFPGWFQNLSAALPFQAIAYLPLSIYLGRLKGMQLWFSLGLQVAWAVGLFLLGRFLWQISQRRLLVQGG